MGGKVRGERSSPGRTGILMGCGAPSIGGTRVQLEAPRFRLRTRSSGGIRFDPTSIRRPTRLSRAGSALLLPACGSHSPRAGRRLCACGAAFLGG